MDCNYSQTALICAFKKTPKRLAASRETLKLPGFFCVEFCSTLFTREIVARQLAVRLENPRCEVKNTDSSGVTKRQKCPKIYTPLGRTGKQILHVATHRIGHP